MSYKPTDQQLEVIQTLKTSKNIVLTDAKAGSGKTSTSQLAVAEIKPKKVLYTAFNKAIVKDGDNKFPENVDCKTLHALALSFVNPKLGIEPFTYLCIKEKLNYQDKAAVIKSIDEFFRSDSLDMYEYLENYLTKKTLVPIALRYVEAMVDDKMPVTFNFLLKYFHILLHEEQIKPTYDMVIMDEIQDSTAVALEIFKLLPATYKLGLGDQFQAIYGFMNLVNGFELLVNVSDKVSLTRSFRCSTNIAARVESFGQKHLHPSFKFDGTNTPVHDGNIAYITATNAMIVYRINKLHKEGKGYILTRPIKDIFAAPLALATASSGKDVLHKQYKFLNFEYKKYTLSNYKSFFQYLRKEVNDDEINSAIDLLMKFKTEGINIFNVLAEAKKVKKDPSITIGTFYSLKGLGYQTVHIEDDLNGMVSTAMEAVMDGVDQANHHTNLKGYYVAATRAKVELINAVHL